MGKKFTHKIYTILSHRETLKRQENQDTHESHRVLYCWWKDKASVYRIKYKKNRNTKTNANTNTVVESTGSVGAGIAG